MPIEYSSPASFTVYEGSTVGGGLSGNPQAVTFTIPSGTYVSATLTVVGIGPGTGVFPVFNTGTGYANTNNISYYQFGSFTVTGTISSASLADINTAAAGSGTLAAQIDGIFQSGPSLTMPVTSAYLTLTKSSTGGSPTQFTVTGTSNGNGCATITVTMLDSAYNLALAPLNGQLFTASTTCSGGNFNPYILTIPQGSSSGSFTYCNQNSGTCTVAVCPGAGPLVAVPCASLSVTISGAPTDPETAVCQITRPLMREAIRHSLGIPTPLDGGIGNAGDEPLGLRWPTNVVLNDKIADAIRIINIKARLHAVVGLTTPVPAYGATYQGPAVVSLAGDPACPTRLSINNVKRVVYTDTAGNIYRLRATSYYDHDKNLRSWDATYPAMAPQEFATEAFSLLIWPAPLIAGTLTLYAGTGFPNFVSDNDWLDQLPIDYQLVIEHIATMLVCMTRLNEPNWMNMYKTYKLLGDDGIKEIKQWHATFNQSYTTQLTPDKGRRRRVR